MVNYWEHTNEYQRILEVLEKYWLTQKHEKRVRVEMYFEHADGQIQEKCIRWENKEYVKEDQVYDEYYPRQKRTP